MDAWLPWTAAACRADFVAGAALCEPGAQISWQAQYRTRGRRWATAACRADFVAGAALREPGV